MTNWITICFDVETKKPVLIDLDKIIKGRALFQANSGGGKSYLLRKFLEESYGKVQHIIIDPEGEFQTLREKYDYLLVGKDNADIQIDINHAALLARKLMENNANAILDLYELNPFERIKYVKRFLDSLMNLPKNLWHPCIVVIDEIHRFAPESSKAESLESVATLASAGRKRKYALIAATQKLSKFHKDVAAELNTKFTGRCTLDIDQKRAAAELGMKNYTELRNLDNEFHVFGPGIEGNETRKVKAYEVKTTHEIDETSEPVKLGNPKKIALMMKNFAELPTEAVNEMKTLQDHKSKILELQSKLNAAEKTNPALDVLETQRSYDKGYHKGIEDSEKKIEAHVKYILAVKKDAEKIQELLQQASKPLELIMITKPNIPSYVPELHMPGPRHQQTPKQVMTEIQTAYNDEELKTCPRKCLETLATFGKPMSRQTLAIYSKYSPRSGGFKDAIKTLRLAGLITENGEIEITSEGIQKAGIVAAMPTNPLDLLQSWKNKLKPCPAKLLDFITTIYPRTTNRPGLAAETGYSATSGGFKDGISLLVKMGLITENNSEIQASKEMFPGAI